MCSRLTEPETIRHFGVATVHNRKDIPVSAKHLGGYVELTRTVDSIRVGARHRTDFGDLTELTDSIRQHGLLQPITVTPDGLLVCGARRLAAIRALEYRTVSVWVRAVSGPLGLLLAEQEENRHHKPLTTLEATALYTELRTVYATEAARRQERTRFAAGEQRPAAGPLDSAAPPSGRPGTARSQAARMVSGRDSSTRFEQVIALQQLADAADAPSHLRELISAELARIDAGAAVHPAVQRVRAHLELARLDERVEASDTTPDERRRLLTAAQAERKRSAAPEPSSPTRATKARAKAGRRGTAPDAAAGRASMPERFDAIWRGLDRWWTDFDPSALGAVLTEAQWQQFITTLQGTSAFADDAAEARQQQGLAAAG